MSGVTSSDNISVFVNTMACLEVLVYTPPWTPILRMVGLNILKYDSVLL